MTISDIILFAFSLLGLFLVPAALGMAAWAVPAGLAGVAAILLLAPAGLHPAVNPWTHVVITQLPWVLFVLDLLFNGRIARRLTPVSIRSLLAFSLFRFMGLRLIFAAATGDLTPLWAVEAASGEFFAALGALILWAIYRPQSRWYRALLIFWNTYALMMALGLNFRVLRADPGLPLSFGHASREVHLFFNSWPNALDAYFWMPVAIGVHAWIFWALWRGTKTA